MTTTIVLTDRIRARGPGGYFSNFTESSVIVPNKPWIHEILEEKLDSEVITHLSVEQLQECITTCIYFGLSSIEFTRELFWNVAETQELFAVWFEHRQLVPTTSTKSQNSSLDQKQEAEVKAPSPAFIWNLRSNISEPLRSELVTNWGSELNYQKLVKLGCRCLRPSYKEIAFSGNLRLLRWVREQSMLAEQKIDYPKDKLCWDEEVSAVAAGNGHLEILKYLREEKCPWNEKSSNEAAKSGHLEVLKYLREEKCPWNETTCSSAAYGGHLECLKYLHAGCFNETTSQLEGGGCPWNETTCSSAAYGGHLECLKYVHENGCPWNKEIYVAVASGPSLRIEILKYIHRHLVRDGDTWVVSSCNRVNDDSAEGCTGCPWDEGACAYFAERGNLECLKYAHENGCPWDVYVCKVAAEIGSLECLKYAHENGCPWNEVTCTGAASHGQLECLKYAHENGCPWDQNACRYAAHNGHLECLKYLHENGCPWDQDTCTYAAHNGHLECLKYAHENECPWDQDTCTYAAHNGHLECLKYAHGGYFNETTSQWEGGGCPWNEDTCARAAHNGHLECLKYAHQHLIRDGDVWVVSSCRPTSDGNRSECKGCPWDIKTSECAAAGGHLECLKYAHVGCFNETTSQWEGGGCPWGSVFELGRVCKLAAAGGTPSHLECLKYAHENGCPWDQDTCDIAAGNGRLASLKYAHENGCPWGAETCSAAALAGQLECLKYAHENGCPWNSETYTEAVDGGHDDCLKYVRDNGCPRKGKSAKKKRFTTYSRK